MKKFLLLAMLVGVGTTVFGATTSDTFSVKLNVLDPLTIESTQDADFGIMDIDSVQAGVQARGKFIVVGASDAKVGFDAVITQELTNGTDTIAITAIPTEIGGTDDLSDGVDLDTTGNYEGDLLVELQDGTSTMGQYDGEVQITVSYL